MAALLLFYEKISQEYKTKDIVFYFFTDSGHVSLRGEHTKRKDKMEEKRRKKKKRRTRKIRKRERRSKEKGREKRRKEIKGKNT